VGPRGFEWKLWIQWRTTAGKKQEWGPRRRRSRCWLAACGRRSRRRGTQGGPAARAVAPLPCKARALFPPPTPPRVPTPPPPQALPKFPTPTAHSPITLCTPTPRLLKTTAPLQSPPHSPFPHVPPLPCTHLPIDQSQHQNLRLWQHAIHTLALPRGASAAFNQSPPAPLQPPSLECRWWVVSEKVTVLVLYDVAECESVLLLTKGERIGRWVPSGKLVGKG
jgi:hypothetical protein